MKKHVDTMITAFRDGFQSVYGARVLTEDFLPAVEAAADAGFSHFEAGGGARFQSLYFYCNQDAFEMMDAFREKAGPDANLQTLARGINVVGLDSQPRDIIELHAKLFKKHGITSIRNFDALNDVNNLIYSGECIKKAGLSHEVCITLMELPPGSSGAHDAAFYMKVLRDILDSGLPYDSVCFKDASGTSVPSKVYETVKKARKLLGDNMKIVFHTHETAGTSITSYKAALEAGANQIDLSMAPVAGGTAQPDVMTMWHALRDTEYDLGVDIKKVMEAEQIFKECMKDYFLPPEALKVEPLIPFSPMPGGALTANTQMLRDNDMMDRYDEISRAMEDVIQKGGFGTSVTPVSQFYFQQAFNNVMFGSWKKIAEGYGKMVLGYFGSTPVEPDPKVVSLASEQLGLETTSESPLDINDKDESKGVEKASKDLEEAGLEINDENIFIAATCREKGIAYLKGEGTLGIRKKDEPVSDSGVYSVKLDGKKFVVDVSRDGVAEIDGKTISYEISADDSESSENKSGGGDIDVLNAPLAGIVLRLPCSEGDLVDEGETMIVLESMKMETPVTAPSSGKILKIHVKQGQQIKSGEPLLEWEV
ncbi:MAG: biotin/lipoyl-containing protein [bacterium]